MITFLRNGSGTWTALLFASAFSASSVNEAKAAPPKPDPSVALPNEDEVVALATLGHSAVDDPIAFDETQARQR